ncbi:uncharacterized protein prr14 [Antennarius striatus]|uniref:uncharacterized protein prr14 n=1 Tax=Antennarius striatus TaxID=241820 RepID=UPI0035B22B9A
MLTYPSDPPPHIVCPMDEDAISPNRLCSAPPYSEPPPPLSPFSSITPSCTNDGISGHIEGIAAQTPKKQSSPDSGAADEPSRQNPSPSRRQERENLVRASESRQPRVESTLGNEIQSKDGFDFSHAAESQKELEEQKTLQKNTNIGATKELEHFPDGATLGLNRVQSDVGTFWRSADAAESTCEPKGWVIGPLFQSFKSKMASFTEIVMSPVKLFRASSPPLDCELRADEPFHGEQSKTSNLLHSEALSENGYQGAGGGAKNVATDYSEELTFSTRSSERADECAISQSETDIPDSVPSPRSPLRVVVSEDVSKAVGSVLPFVLLQPFVDVSASHEATLKLPRAGVKHKDKLPEQLKPLPRKRTGNRKRVPAEPVTSDVTKKGAEVVDTQVSLIDSVQSNHLSDVDGKMSPPLSVCHHRHDAGCAQAERDRGRKTEDHLLVPQSPRDSVKDAENRSMPQPDGHMDPETYLAAQLGRTKRQLNLEDHSMDSVKRKKLTVDVYRLDVRNSERGLRPQMKAALTDEQGEKRLRPARIRQDVSSGANKAGGEQETLTALSERVLNTRTEPPSDPVVVCSLEKINGGAEEGDKDSSKAKLSRRQKTRAGLGYPDNMALETTIAITSTKRAEEEQLSDVLIGPDVKPIHNTRKGREVNKKPLKRKSPHQASSNTGTAAFTSSVEPLEVTTTVISACQHGQKEDGDKTELKQTSKKPKKGRRGEVKASAASRSKEIEPSVHVRQSLTKESQTEEDNGKLSTDPVYFEMTPFESNHQVCPEFSQPPLDLPLDEVQHEAQGEEKNGTSVWDEAVPGESTGVKVSRLRRRVNNKSRPADNQRRKCRVLHGSVRKGEDATASVTVDNGDLAPAGAPSSQSGSLSRLSRSYSCPEIPSFRSFEVPLNSLHPPHHSTVPSSQEDHFTHSFIPHQTHKSPRRTRRHTVCSLEVEREIAPLCLRKEVYPSRRSVPYDSFSQILSPSSALSPLASCFLSSPLAFLSKKPDDRGAAAGPSPPGHVSSPTSSSSVYPPKSSTCHLSGLVQRTDSCAAASSSSGISLECEIGRRQTEEEDDGENTSSSSQEFEDVALREEKALSDSEIKVVRKHEERGKVSSIRIRKTLPKPQNNLTPMGLPKPIRLKKKEFSLEEIYTNKNFTKPPESRLETIFEVPLNRRNGSESWFGQRRFKRFLEFLEVGEARKPKKPLVGVGKAGMSSSRTRRGGFPKDEPSVSVQDVDSLLCSKLDQLSLWLMHDQTDS